MVILLNCSFRGEKSNSNYFLGLLEGLLTEPCERIQLNQVKDISVLREKLAAADVLVFGMPLYVDGVPAQAVELMERFYADGAGSLGNLMVYAVSNLGFYEPEQAHIQLAIVRNWCERMNIAFGGAIAVGAGEMMGGLRNVPMDQGPNKAMGEGLKKLAAHIGARTVMEDCFVRPTGFPRRLYLFAAQMNWAPAAKNNGLKRKEIRRRRP